MKYLIHLIWIIPVIMAVRMFRNRDKKDNNKESTPSTPIKWGSLLIKMLGTIVTLFFLLILGSCVISMRACVDRIAQPSHPAPPPTIKKVGKEPKLYKFSDYPSGYIEIPLESDASFYPKGGWVTIKPPYSAKPWDDAPGILNKEEGKLKPPGLYRIYKKSPDAWGIEIWN